MPANPRIGFAPASTAGQATCAQKRPTLRMERSYRAEWGVAKRIAGGGRRKRRGRPPLAGNQDFANLRNGRAQVVRHYTATILRQKSYFRPYSFRTSWLLVGWS